MRVVALTTPAVTARVVECMAHRPIELVGSNTIWSRRPAPLDPDVVVIETACCVHPIMQHTLFQYMATHTNVGMVLAGELDSRLAKMVVEVAKGRKLDVVLTGTDSAPQIWNSIKHAYLPTLVPRVWVELQPALLPLDPEIQQIVRLALLGDATINTMPDLAAHLGKSTRTLYRHLQRAGLEYPKDLIRVGRVLKNLPHLYGRGSRLSEIYKEFGYADYYDFQNLLKRLTGYGPRELRYRADPALLPARIAKSMFTSPTSRTRKSPALT